MRIGRYDVVRRLAVGGMGEIFLARQRGPAGFDRVVVVKRLLPEMARRPDIRTMFLDEARIVAQLCHPGIPQIYELGEDEGAPFLAMEYVPGADLSQIVQRAAVAGLALPRPLVAYIVAETARALDFAHRARDVNGAPLGIVHRDISPGNVMITVHGDIKLMDFGIARAENRRYRTVIDRVKGKIAYMAPEQLRCEEVDARADVFSLGVVLWEMTLQQRLFRATSDVETYQRALAGVVPAPRALDPSYPPALEAAVLAALARDRRRRTPTAGHLESALRAWLAAEGCRVGSAEVLAWVTCLVPEAVPGPLQRTAAPDAATLVPAVQHTVRQS